MDTFLHHGTFESFAARSGLRRGLDLSLVLLRLPTRMDNYAYSHGLETVRDLVRLDPATLLRVRNLGRVSLQQTRDVLERLLGRTWEAVRDELTMTETPRLHG